MSIFIQEFLTIAYGIWFDFNFDFLSAFILFIQEFLTIEHTISLYKVVAREFSLSFCFYFVWSSLYFLVFFLFLFRYQRERFLFCLCFSHWLIIGTSMFGCQQNWHGKHEIQMYWWVFSFLYLLLYDSTNGLLTEFSFIFFLQLTLSYVGSSLILDEYYKLKLFQMAKNW